MLKLYTEYTGTEFNKYHKQQNTKFYIFIYEWTNNSKYVLGLNIYPKPFDLTNYLDGFYFCDKSKCHLHFERRSKLALVEIPNDARVYVERDEFKTDRLMIKEIKNFKDVDDQFWIDIVPKNGNALQYVKEQTNIICEVAVKQNNEALRYVKLQYGEVCKVAVQRNGMELRYVLNQTPEICVAAIKQNYKSIQFIKKSSEALN